MTNLTRGTRLQIMLTEEELLALDDWRFRYRMPSRASAVREILRKGLAAEGIIAVTGKKKSSEYGVVEATPGIVRRKRSNGAAKTT